MMNKKHKKYEGFSLVEMLITIFIIGIVMVISGLVLTTLVKVSTVATDKIQARNESEFVLELLRRTVRNSDPSDVYIFNSTSGRRYNPETNLMVNTDEPLLNDIYAQNLEEGEIGNEIHFRPYGYQDWICLGFFKSSDGTGYILKTFGENLLNNHRSCFEPGLTPSSYLMILNSDNINIKDFSIMYTESGDANYIIKIGILSEPNNWYLSSGSPIKREVYRQATVSTEGITW